MMLFSRILMSASAFALAVAAGIVCTAPQAQQIAAASQEAYPQPTNLKVLPKDSTGAQVHELMEQWKRQLNMDCNACHKEEFKNGDADGRPILNFADDSKPEKRTARVMYTMTEDINARYLAKIDSSGMPVTCGTCHRGHVGPELMELPLREPKDMSKDSATPTESARQR